MAPNIFNYLLLNIENHIDCDVINIKIDDKDYTRTEYIKFIKEKLKKMYGSSKTHLKTITKFSRYPHRNKVLNRENTPDEDLYLQSKKLPKWTKIKLINNEKNEINNENISKTNILSNLEQTEDNKYSNVKITNKSQFQNMIKDLKPLKSKSKLKILVLHSNRQNSQSFKIKTKKFFSDLNKNQNFDY